MHSFIIVDLAISHLFASIPQKYDERRLEFSLHAPDICKISKFDMVNYKLHADIARHICRLYENAVIEEPELLNTISYLQVITLYERAKKLIILTQDDIDRDIISSISEIVDTLKRILLRFERKQ